MSVNAIGAVSLSAQHKSQSKPATPAPDVTPFSQQLDTQTAQAGATHNHHQHGVGAKSVTSSATTAASAAGTTPGSSVLASLMHLLS